MTVHARVSGLVQGVCFRDFTQRAARNLGLVGWVRNRSDGTVELAATGTRPALEKLLSLLRQGPPLARVENLAADWCTVPEPFTDFHIRY